MPNIAAFVRHDWDDTLAAMDLSRSSVLRIRTKAMVVDLTLPTALSSASNARATAPPRSPTAAAAPAVAAPSARRAWAEIGHLGAILGEAEKRYFRQLFHR
jgi:hypothetical protein